MTSDELTKQLKHCGLTYMINNTRAEFYNKNKIRVFTLPVNSSPKYIELRLREYKKEIKKREIKITTESMQGELL